jgi:hypothetical protein
VRTIAFFIITPKNVYPFAAHPAIRHRDAGEILKNKPQINADERRFIDRFYESNWLSCFSVTQ